MPAPCLFDELEARYKAVADRPAVYLRHKPGNRLQVLLKRHIRSRDNKAAHQRLLERIALRELGQSALRACSFYPRRNRAELRQAHADYPVSVYRRQKRRMKLFIFFIREPFELFSYVHTGLRFKSYINCII